MKYQVLFEHPCLQMKRYFCSTLMLSAWWENRTDQPSMSFHYVTADRVVLDITFRYRFLFDFIRKPPAETLEADRL